MKSAIDNIHEVPGLMIIQLDPQKRYVWCTHQLSEIVKVPTVDIIGKTPQDFFLPSMLTEFDLAWNEAIKTKHHISFTMTIPNPSRTLPTVIQQWTGTFTPHLDKNGDIYRVTFVTSDNTKAWKESLERNKMLIEREFFFRIASHDLKTPLTSMKSCLELIQKNPKNLDRLLCIMNSSINKMEGLIRDYLDWGKIVSGKLNLDFNIHSTHDLISDVLGMISPEAAIRGILLKSEVNADTFFGDRTRVTQVLSNLVSNALKHGVKQEANKEIKITADRVYSHGVTFCVKDSGPGISEEMKEKVFELYWQGAHNHEGVGLGLTICKSLVEVHGGKIWVESTPGIGCAFCFTLPDQVKL